MAVRFRLLLLSTPIVLLLLSGLLGCSQISSLLDQAPTADFTVSPSTTVAVNTQITLNASTSSDPQSYTLSYEWTLTPPANSNAVLSRTDAEVVTFTPDIAGDYTVLLRVTATSGAKKSASKSKTIIATTGAGGTVSAPTGLSAIASPSAMTIGLSWTASATAGATYNVYRGQSSGGESPTAIATGLSTTSYTDNDVALQPSTTYYYVVTAVSGGTESLASNEASATTPSSASASINVTIQ